MTAVVATEWYVCGTPPLGRICSAVIYTSHRIGWIIDGGASDFRENCRVHTSPPLAGPSDSRDE